VSEVRFEVADVAEIRFCVSPLWETVTSLWALAQPGRHALHLPWIKAARPLARRRDLAGPVELLTAFVRPRSWLPDFLTPPPASPLLSFADELDTVLATPPAEVRRDVLVTAESRPLSPLAQRVADEPETMLPRLVAAVRAWHDAAILPHWPRMRALLEADIAYRARQLADGGARLLFDTLHPTARWDGDRLAITDRWTQSLTVSGRGFPLMPSVFADKGPLISCSNDSAPGAVYPARAVGTLWEGIPSRMRSGGGRPPAASRAAALGGILGPARARLLELLRAPGTTSDLAHRTGLSIGAVSQQLGLLHDARLIGRNRQGRSVYYLCTDLGVALLDGES
jgi:DNA-binding transcriptional ArsR family regulator